MTDKIQDVERHILNYIIDFKTINGYSPTRDEIARALNTRSKSYVDEKMDKLKANGYIDYIPYVGRTIRVLKFKD